MRTPFVGVVGYLPHECVRHGLARRCFHKALTSSLDEILDYEAVAGTITAHTEDAAGQGRRYRVAVRGAPPVRPARSARA